MNEQPPKRALQFLRWFCRAEHLEEIEGNLIELYEQENPDAPGKANRHFYWNLLRHFRPEFIRPLFKNELNYYGMLRHHLKFSLRFFWKNRFFSLINLIGLSIGLAAALLIIFNLRYELSFDRHHQRADRIVRVHVEASVEGTSFKIATAPNQAAPFLQEQLPEVDQALRVFPHNFGQTASIGVGAENFVEEGLFWADSNLFEVLTVPLIIGQPEMALNRTNTAVVSAATARRYFGNENPIGKTLSIDNQYELEVTGVFEDPPENTSLPFNVIGSFHTISMGKSSGLSWGNASFYTYLLLHPGVDIATVERKLPAVKANIPEDRQWFDLRIMPLTDVHLYSGEIDDELQGQGDITRVWVMTALALVLILIACINYMNLATARSEQKSKLVAINKTLGASSGQILVQFFVETGLLTLLAVLVSALIVWMTLPYFNQITGRAFSLEVLLQPGLLTGVAIGWLVLTLIAGIYPALFLAAHRPLDLLRKNRQIKLAGLPVRKGLVVFQLSISSVLIVSTLLLNQQLLFISNKKLGYDPEQLIALRVMGLSDRENIEALERELRRQPAVVNTVRAQTYPGQSTSVYNLTKPNTSEKEGAELTTCRAQPDIFDVLGMELIAGRTLKKRAEADTVVQVVLNRSAIDFLGWSPTEAIGKRLDDDLGLMEIVGVVEDFHYHSLHKPIGYYAFHNRGDTWMPYLLIKLETADLPQAITQVKATFERMAPTTAFEYTFLDESIGRLYEAEQRLTKLVLIFAGLAVWIACLGIFALTAFATERRTKEIGIRKVLGATVANIVGLLSKDFLKLTLVAFSIAVPFSWWMMNRWLQDFAYRIEIRWWVFAVAGILAVLITLLTVSLQSVRAATANTVECLKNE